MHGWLFKDIHAAKLEALAMLLNYPLKINNLIVTCFIHLNIILYHVFYQPAHNVHGTFPEGLLKILTPGTYMRPSGDPQVTNRKLII